MHQIEGFGDYNFKIFPGVISDIPRPSQVPPMPRPNRQFPLGSLAFPLFLFYERPMLHSLFKCVCLL